MNHRSKLLTKLWLILVLSGFFETANSQQLTILDSSHGKVSFRGLSVPAKDIVWVSGSRGTIGKSCNAGNSWEWVNPTGFEKRDFRDIIAFNSYTAITVAVDSPGIILRTTDGGKNWNIVYQNNSSGIFLDDFAFSSASTGLCIGDPIDERLILLGTLDSGKTWTLYPPEKRPKVEKGEAMFAASGSNLIPLKADKNFDYALITGGIKSRVWFIPSLKNQETPFPISLPIIQGKETTGANAIISNKKHYYIIGGDFSDTKNQENIFIKANKKGISLMPVMPSGYKSSLIVNPLAWVSCGTTGIEWLPKKGKETQWETISSLSMHVIREQPGTNHAFVAGSNGKIGFVSF